MTMMQAEQLGYPSFGAQYADDRLAMELPGADEPWPPIRWNPILYDYRMWDAWWSGDPDKLMRAYYSLGENSPVGRQFFANTGEPGVTSARPGRYRGGLIGSIRRFFWGTPTPPGEKRTNYHVPLAADLCSASAGLLFSQPPALTSPDGGPAQDWLESAVDDGMHAKFLEASETAAALGGVFLRTVWDTDVSDSAWLDLVPPDAAVPEWRYDRLAAVTFWTVLEDHGKTEVQLMVRQRPKESAQSRQRARVTGGRGFIFLQGTHVVKMTLPLHPTIQKAWVAGKLTRVNEDGSPYQGDHYALPGKSGRAAPLPDDDEDAPARPKPNASRATWAHYAVAIGACTEDEASQLTRDQLVDLATAPEDKPGE